ncbi:MAG: Methylaspartate ammonia-lyase [Candidatus Ozemobacter sibiricus]|uniref:methylaspartate ammonia-lyase n=1 Tax=Candidatus Ozemobacter sibiricus TaxID=2268124 RepID=A0A367ZTE0_9BACT|nr:MAG: Methylaspartate ammonia-lyase [Candidatus Ozemobacter sibiricus]
MKIAHALFSPGISAFFFDDQRAIKRGAPHDGFIYLGEPVTPRFRRIREAGQSISVQLILEDGQIAVGDCAAVQYSGAGGRDPLFLAADYIPVLERHVRPRLEGMEIDRFRAMVEPFMSLTVDGERLHTALRYGLSQALLDARAKACRRLPTEIICEEYGLPVIAERVPVFGQSGDSRYENVDKMILKGVEVLPHGLINNIDEKLGRDGSKLREYIRWLARRTRELAPRDDYRPTLHLDVYGTIGLAFNFDLPRITDYLASLEADADGLPLYIEGPVDREEKPATIDSLREITQGLERRGSRVRIVADEWCNTYEDVKEFVDARACHMVQIKTPDLGGIQTIVDSVLYCKRHGVEAYQGGTCNETDVSARLCVHLAMAARADRMLAKPGMGFDEGFTIVNNEMERIIRYLRWKQEGGAAR